MLETAATADSKGYRSAASVGREVNQQHLTCPAHDREQSRAEGPPVGDRSEGDWRILRAK